MNIHENCPTHAHRQAAAVRSSLPHHRRYRPSQHGFRNAPRIVAPDVARDLSATDGLADENGVLKSSISTIAKSSA
jgi:hypothetical protein